MPAEGRRKHILNEEERYFAFLLRKGKSGGREKVGRGGKIRKE